jgi:hypothetical protein
MNPLKPAAHFQAWLYPGAKCDSIVTNAPMTYARLISPRPIEEVASFYRLKAAKDNSYGQKAHRNEIYWGDQTDGGTGLNGGVTEREGVDVCLYVVRQARHTITIQLTREAQPGKGTQIVMIASAR